MITTVTVNGVDVPAETTDNPHLVIAPAVDGRGLLCDDWRLLHLPTGMSLPTPLMSGVVDLRLIASAVADLDWSSPDPKHYASEDGRDLGQKYRDAMRKAELAEPPAVDPEDRKSGDIPHEALPMVSMFLDSYQRCHDRTSNEDHPRYVPFELPDGTTNPEWGALIIRMCDAFTNSYVLAALHRTDPEVADSVASTLADWLESGETGEWVWQWRQEIAAGKPPTLPGVPTPISGELFAEASA